LSNPPRKMWWRWWRLVLLIILADIQPTSDKQRVTDNTSVSATQRSPINQASHNTCPVLSLPINKSAKYQKKKHENTKHSKPQSRSFPSIFLATFLSPSSFLIFPYYIPLLFLSNFFTVLSLIFLSTYKTLLGSLSRPRPFCALIDHRPPRHDTKWRVVFSPASAEEVPRRRRPGSGAT
jgi:hypothetical protein